MSQREPPCPMASMRYPAAFNRMECVSGEIKYKQHLGSEIEKQYQNDLVRYEDTDTLK